MTRFLFALVLVMAVLYVATLKTMHIRGMHSSRIHVLGISLPYSEQAIRIIYKIYYPYFAWKEAQIEKSFPVENMTAALRFVNKKDKSIALGPRGGKETSIGIYYTDEQAPLFDNYASLTKIEPQPMVTVRYRKRIMNPGQTVFAVGTEHVLLSLEKVETTDEYR